MQLIRICMWEVKEDRARPHLSRLNASYLTAIARFSDSVMLKKSIQREITNGDDRMLAWLKYPVLGLFITMGIVASL